MGYNQNHAGLHLIPHGYSGLQNEKEYDKYSEMIAETSLIRQEMRKNATLKDIEICNFIIIEKVMGKRKTCLCGGKMNYMENLPIRLHHGGEIITIYVPGKICVDCGRKLMIEKNLLKEIKKQLTICKSSNRGTGK